MRPQPDFDPLEVEEHKLVTLAGDWQDRVAFADLAGPIVTLTAAGVAGTSDTLKDIDVPLPYSGSDTSRNMNSGHPLPSLGLESGEIPVAANVLIGGTLAVVGVAWWIRQRLRSYKTGHNF